MAAAVSTVRTVVQVDHVTLIRNCAGVTEIGYFVISFNFRIYDFQDPLEHRSVGPYVDILGRANTLT